MKQLQLVPTCVKAWKIRDGLRNLLPDETRRIANIRVTKSVKVHRGGALVVRYKIEGTVYDFEAAVVYLENPPVLLPVLTLVQMELPLEVSA